MKELFKDLVKKELIFFNYEEMSKDKIISFLSKKICTYYKLDCKRIQDNILAREEAYSSGIGAGIAIPHCRMLDIDKICMGVMISKVPLDFKALDNAPVQLIMLFASPLKSAQLHLSFLHFVTGLAQPEIFQKLVETDNAKAFVSLWEQICKK